MIDRFYLDSLICTIALTVPAPGKFCWFLSVASKEAIAFFCAAISLARSSAVASKGPVVGFEIACFPATVSFAFEIIWNNIYY